MYQNYCGWLGWIQFTRIACLLHSFAVSSCSCCVDPSVTINSEQSLNLFKKSKPIKFKILSPNACTAISCTWFYRPSRKMSYRHTDTHTHKPTIYCMPLAHVHQGVIITSKISLRKQKHVYNNVWILLLILMCRLLREM